MASHSQVPHYFLGFIDENTLPNGELMIRRSSVKNYWDEMENPILLVLPNGTEWKVNWKKRYSGIWLRNNWKEFAEFYSLDEGHILIFRYEGMSRFRVVIVDHGDEIYDYPSISRGICNREQRIDNNNNSCKMTRKRSKRPQQFPLPFSQLQKKMKPITDKRVGRRFVYVESGGSDSSETMESEDSVEEDTENSEEESLGEEAENSNSPLKRAQAFQRSCNYPAFICQMHTSYIERHILCVPGHCIRVQQGKADEFVTLRVPNNGEGWNVKVTRNRNHRSGQVTFGADWKGFAVDNNLKIGDVCVFEEINSVGDTFRVSIFRAKQQESNFPLYQAKRKNEANQTKPKGLQHNFAESSRGGIAKKSSRTIHVNPKISGNDHFTISLKPNQADAKRIYIPNAFLRKYVKEDVKEAILRIGESSWPVKLDYYPGHNYGRFSVGWTDFVRDCMLKPGDVCLFHLVYPDPQNFVLQVTVSSHNNY